MNDNENKSTVENQTSVDEEIANNSTESEEKEYESIVISEDDLRIDDYDESNEQSSKKKKRKDKKPKKKHKAITAIIVAIIIIAISVGLAVAIIDFGVDFFGIYKDNTVIEITIPEGSTNEEIISILEDNGIINSPLFFKTFLKVKGSEPKFNYGCYDLYPSMGYLKLVTTLESKNSVKNIVDVTIPEGKTIDEIAAILEENEICAAADFIEVINKTDYGYKFEKKIIDSGKTYYAREGYVFPDTYKFYKNGQMENIVSAFYRNFDKKFTDEMYTRANELNVDLNEIITLASMIQQEAGSSEQMAIISSIFWNRLNSPDFGRLQSDPTKKYVEEVIMAGLKESQYTEYQEMFNSYDTYECQGLPIGPICNPGLEAITAALYPAETNYYYFCHNVNTGEVYYASTLAEHNANLVKAGLA